MLSGEHREGLLAVVCNRELADRIREALAAKPSVREVKMFGGLSFMVNERIVVGVKNDGDLLVRVDPERADELLKTKGARSAEMGAGRVMNNGWISVSEEGSASDESFDFWIGVALEYNAVETGRRSRARRDPVMPHSTPTAELLFAEKDATPMSTDEATVKPWSQARACLQSASKIWLSTVRPDGRPHVMPVLLVWVDDAPCFATRPTSRKARNLARNAHCTLTVAGEDLDLVVEGSATRIADQAELLRVAAALHAKYEWELAVRDGKVHDHRLPGSPEYGFYQVRFLRAFGYGADGLTATRWRFG